MQDARHQRNGVARIFELPQQPERRIGHWWTAAKVHASRFATWIEARSGPDPTEEPTRSVRFAEGTFASDVDNLAESAYHLAGLVDAAANVRDAAREHARTSEQESDEAEAQVLRFVREALGRGLLEPSPDS